MNNYIEYFTNYVYKNYDINNELIKLKYFHSLRVAKLMMILSSKMNLSDEDRLLAFKLGLSHDLGRFYEVVLNGKFNDIKFDHGSYSNKILYNDLFISYMDVNEHLLFRKAIYNHNKKDITKDLNEREKVFVNMLRDADKIDILNVITNYRKFELIDEPTKQVINDFYNNGPINIIDIHNKSDSVIFYLNFFKELYYEISKDIANNYGYLDNFIKSITVSDSKRDLYNKIIEKIDNERGKVYVR